MGLGCGLGLGVEGDELCPPWGERAVQTPARKELGNRARHHTQPTSERGVPEGMILRHGRGWPGVSKGVGKGVGKGLARGWQGGGEGGGEGGGNEAGRRSGGLCVGPECGGDEGRDELGAAAYEAASGPRRDGLSATLPRVHPAGLRPRRLLLVKLHGAEQADPPAWA